MKKNLLRMSLLLSFLIISFSGFAQQAKKEQLIREINALFLSAKQWDYEGIVVDNSGSLKYHICLTPECNPFVSWDFYIKNLKSIEAGRFEEYSVVTFTCNQKNCIVPTGYEKGGKYETKNELQFFVKEAKQAKELAAKLMELMKMDLDK